MSGVLDLAALTVVVVNLPFALYGYLMFGSSTKGASQQCNFLIYIFTSPFDLYTHTGYIFENLAGGTFNDVVRILLSIELTLTFPIVIKPATDVMEEILKNILMVRVETV